MPTILRKYILTNNLPFDIGSVSINGQLANAQFVRAGCLVKLTFRDQKTASKKPRDYSIDITNLPFGEYIKASDASSH